MLIKLFLTNAVQVLKWPFSSSGGWSLWKSLFRYLMYYMGRLLEVWNSLLLIWAHTKLGVWLNPGRCGRPIRWIRIFHSNFYIPKSDAKTFSSKRTQPRDPHVVKRRQRSRVISRDDSVGNQNFLEWNKTTIYKHYTQYKVIWK